MYCNLDYKQRTYSVTKSTILVLEDIEYGCNARYFVPFKQKIILLYLLIIVNNSTYILNINIIL